MEKTYKFFIDITSKISVQADSEEEARLKITPEEVSRLFNQGLMATDVTFDEIEED